MFYRSSGFETSLLIEGFLRLIHHQLPGSCSERCFKAAGIKTRFAEISAVKYDVVFTQLIGAFFGSNFPASGIKNAQEYICGSWEAKPKQSHFNEWIWGVLKQFNASFGGLAD